MYSAINCLLTQLLHLFLRYNEYGSLRSVYIKCVVSESVYAFIYWRLYILNIALTIRTVWWCFLYVDNTLFTGVHFDHIHTYNVTEMSMAYSLCLHLHFPCEAIFPVYMHGSRKEFYFFFFCFSVFVFVSFFFLLRWMLSVLFHMYIKFYKIHIHGLNENEKSWGVPVSIPARNMLCV